MNINIGNTGNNININKDKLDNPPLARLAKQMYLYRPAPSRMCAD